MTAGILAATGSQVPTRAVAGAAVAVVSALLYDLGYVLEKQALSTLPPLALSPAALWRTATTSRRWSAGFAAMLAGLALQVVALTLAPVAVVQPILAGGLVALTAVGPSVLGERLSGRQRYALAMVVVAVAAVAVSARDAGALSHTVSPARFAELAAAVAVLAALALRGARRAGSGLAASAVAAGLLYGLGAVAEKAVATDVVDRGVLGGAGSALAGPYPWLFVVATLAGMVVFQTGLQAHPATLMASLTNVTSTVCALAGASVVFGEALTAAGWWSLVRVAGLGAVLAAVVLLGAGRASPAPVGAADGSLVG